MSCEFEHERDDAELQKLVGEGLDVRLSYDGMSVELELSTAAIIGERLPVVSAGSE